jgi:outer membrane protein assembly factor BamB
VSATLRALKRSGALLAGLALGGCVSVGKPLPFAHNPFTASEGPQGQLALYSINWWHSLVPPLSYEYAPREFATPAVDPQNDRVLAVTRDGAVKAFNRLGTPVWRFQTHGRFEAGPLVQDGVAYVPGGDGNLYALDVRTGTQKWMNAAGEALGTVPVVADGKLVVASAADTVFVVDAATGKWLWQYRRDTPEGFTIHGTARPAVRDGVVYAGFSDGHLVALDLATGDVTWDRALSTATQFPDVDTEPLFTGDGALIAASYSDGLYSLDPKSGDVRWHVAASDGISSTLLKGGVVFAAGARGLSAYTTQSGLSIWNLPLGARAGQQPVFAGGLLLVPTVQSLDFVDPSTGKVQLRFDPGAGVSATPAAAGDHAYVLSNNGYIYAMEIRG